MLLNKPYIIGLGGGSASGKTTIANSLYEKFKNSEKIMVIREDDYYKDQSHLTFEQRTKTNYDHPGAFDHDLMKKQIEDLLNGKSIKKPTYDFTIHNRSNIIEELAPKEIIIIEGLFVLQEPIIRDLLDLAVYVDCPYDIRFIRRMLRDVKERQRELDGIVDQWLTTVREMHELFIEPSKKYADIIIPNQFYNDKAVNLLEERISKLLNC